VEWRTIYQSNLARVAAAITGTVALNLVLFSVLPYLTQVEDDLLVRTLAPAVSVVRVAPVKPPPRQQANKKPPEPVKQVQQMAQPRPAQPTPELKLDLMLQPEFSRALGTVALPEVQLARLDPVPEIFDSAALDQPLTPLAQSPFIYPLRAKRLGIEGWVRIKLLISKQGDVEQVIVIDAQPKDVFEPTVERGVKMWRFSPGTVDGEPVRSWVTTTVRFELES
jgi:protein TonB